MEKHNRSVGPNPLGPDRGDANSVSPAVDNVMSSVASSSDDEQDATMNATIKTMLQTLQFLNASILIWFYNRRFGSDRCTAILRPERLNTIYHIHINVRFLNFNRSAFPISLITDQASKPVCPDCNVREQPITTDPLRIIVDFDHFFEIPLCGGDHSNCRLLSIA